MNRIVEVRYSSVLAGTADSICYAFWTADMRCGMPFSIHTGALDPQLLPFSCMQGGCAMAADFIQRICEEPSLKGELLQHVPALLQTLAGQQLKPATPAAATAASVLCRLSLDSFAQGSNGKGAPLYSGSHAWAALAGCDLAPLQQGMLSRSSNVSANCAATLHNVTLAAAGKQALCKHVAALVQALQPGHACRVAQLAFSTVELVSGGGEAGRAAVLQHVCALAYGVHQLLAACQDCKSKMLQPYVLLVQQLLKAAEGVACFSQPEVLDELLTHLLSQFVSGAKSADREAAGSCIETLAAAALDGLRKSLHVKLHKRLKDAAAEVEAAARAARAGAARRAAEAAWQAALNDAAAVFPAAEALSALSAAELKKMLRDEVRQQCRAGRDRQLLSTACSHMSSLL
jgi:hypothetical protein